MIRQFHSRVITCFTFHSSKDFSKTAIKCNYETFLSLYFSSCCFGDKNISHETVTESMIRI